MISQNLWKYVSLTTIAAADSRKLQLFLDCANFTFPFRPSDNGNDLQDHDFCQRGLPLMTVTLEEVNYTEGKIAWIIYCKAIKKGVKISKKLC